MPNILQVASDPQEAECQFDRNHSHPPAKNDPIVREYNYAFISSLCSSQEKQCSDHISHYQ
jgi:hypothetical protein